MTTSAHVQWRNAGHAQFVKNMLCFVFEQLSFAQQEGQEVMSSCLSHSKCWPLHISTILGLFDHQVECCPHCRRNVNV